jgi:urease subunit gamma
MNLTPKERERMTTFVAAEIARRRRDRGVALNHPEAVALLSDWCIERARDGDSVAEIRAGASRLLSREDVMEGVPEMIDMVQVEPVFPDGTKLVTVHDPIRSDEAMAVGDGDEDEDEDGDATGEAGADGANVADGAGEAGGEGS